MKKNNTEKINNIHYVYLSNNKQKLKPHSKIIYNTGNLNQIIIYLNLFLFIKIRYG